MKKTSNPLTRSRLLYGLYIAAVVPFLFILGCDFYAEWSLVLLGESSDAPHHAAMAGMVSALSPVALVALLGATVLSIYAGWEGAFILRTRILTWYSCLLLAAIFLFVGPTAAQFHLRIYFVLYQGLLVVPLALLPAFWLLGD